ncbi:hypothetical protein C9374_007060 [Naegleria lovaniensis]|uniref:Macroglobulin domain-containing protein n=1 Tax=Naegleria lovaniensis TaxID=51637 RepID=A0AA88H4Q0_NAELO|nr:uncharacterized protein C9374_007060 [Naegleria lovaniensis]KAG2393529.1 hypothetical protein C9374_007060 [Naegleria lovaniensis]
MQVSPNSSDFTVFVTSFQDGKPVPNAKVVYTYTGHYYPTENGFDEKRMEGTTNEKGFVSFEGAPDRLGYHPMIHVSTENDSVTYTNVSAGYINRQGNQLLAHIFNDRGLYKPNEMAHFKGFTRAIQFDFSKGSNKYGTYAINIPTNCSGSYTFYDSRRVKYAEGKIEANSNGSFEIELKIPDNVNLGSHYIDIRLQGHSFTHNFSVEEFRTPEYNVSSNIIPSSLKVANYVGDKLVCKVSANYYSGGALEMQM